MRNALEGSIGSTSPEAICSVPAVPMVYQKDLEVRPNASNEASDEEALKTNPDKRSKKRKLHLE